MFYHFHQRQASQWRPAIYYPILDSKNVAIDRTNSQFSAKMRSVLVCLLSFLALIVASKAQPNNPGKHYILLVRYLCTRILQEELQWYILLLRNFFAAILKVKHFTKTMSSFISDANTLVECYTDLLCESGNTPLQKTRRDCCVGTQEGVAFKEEGGSHCFICIGEFGSIHELHVLNNFCWLGFQS